MKTLVLAGVLAVMGLHLLAGIVLVTWGAGVVTLGVMELKNEF